MASARGGLAADSRHSSRCRDIFRAGTGGADQQEGRAEGRRPGQRQRQGDVLGHPQGEGRSQQGFEDRQLERARTARRRRAQEDRGRQPGRPARLPEEGGGRLRTVLDHQRDQGERGPGSAEQPGERSVGRADRPRQDVRGAEADPRFGRAEGRHRRMECQRHRRAERLADIRRPRRGHRRREHRHRCAVRPSCGRRGVSRQSRQRPVRPQLQLVRSRERVREPGSMRQRRARDAHDGNHGRRRRGRQPDRRRSAREVDRGQGLRDQLVLARRAAPLGAVGDGSDRPERKQPTP